MSNLVFRKGTIPTTNSATLYKNFPLTNDELDNNFFGLDLELSTKAPISNAVFTGSTTIPNINALGGVLNGVTIGGSSQGAGSFTTLVSTSSSLVGSVAATTVSLFNTSTGTINLGGAASNVSLGNNLNVVGDVTIQGGGLTIGEIPTVAAIDVGQPVSLFATSTAGITIGAASNGTTAVRYDFSVGRNATITGSVTLGGAPIIVGSVAANTVSLFNTSTGTINLGGAASTVAIGANVTVGGTSTVTGTSTVNGNATFNGNVTLGDAVGDIVTITAGTIAGSPNFTGSPTYLTFPIVNTQTTQTLQNKTINLTNNTLVATSAQLLAAVTDETGSGALVFANTPTLVTPNIGVATATSINKVTITAPATSATLTIANGKTLTANNTLTLNGTDGSSVSFGTGGTVTYTSNKLNVFAATTSAELAGVISDETGSGALVFATSPILLTPTIGVASATSLSASGNVSGSTLTSTAVIGTAPMTVTSTTKVVNLNADRVDDIVFNAPTVTGGVPYVSATAAGNHTISFINAGSSGTILSSSGGGAPSWIAISGLSAGSSKAAEHILGGNTGDMLYQNARSALATTTINSTTVTVDITGLLAGMIVSGNGNIPGGTYIVSVGAGTIVISEQATATGTVSTSFTETKKVPIGTINQVLTSNGSIPAWSSTLSVGGLTHTGLTPSAGTNIDQVYSVTDTLIVTTGWVNTSVNAAELTTGSYLVQLIAGLELYTGMMSWYQGDTSSAVVDEIVLHRASAGTESSALFLRVERTDNDVSPDMTLQISSSANRVSSSYTFKFRRMM